MTALPQWTINTRPRLPTIMPDPRAYNPAAWTFHTTMMPGETLEEWIGRDMALRCRAEGHVRGVPSNSQPSIHNFKQGPKRRLSIEATDAAIIATLSNGRPWSVNRMLKHVPRSHNVIREACKRLTDEGVLVQIWASGKVTYRHVDAMVARPPKLAADVSQ